MPEQRQSRSAAALLGRSPMVYPRARAHALSPALFPELINLKDRKPIESKPEKHQPGPFLKKRHLFTVDNTHITADNTHLDADKYNE